MNESGQASSVAAPILLLGLLFLLFGHLRLVNGGGHALYLPFNSISWIPVFVVIGVACWKIGSTRNIQFSNMTRNLLISCGLLCLPLLYLNAVIGESIYRILGLLTGLALFISLQQYRMNQQALTLIMLLVILGVWIESFRYWWAMLDGYSTNQRFPTDDLELHGVFQQRNVMSSFVATGLVFSAYLLGQIKEIRYRKTVTTLLILTPLFTTQILTSMASRAGWYGAVLGLLLILSYLCKNANRKLIVLWLAMAVAGWSISFLLSNVGDWSAPAKNVLSLAGPRTALFPQAIGMILAKPLLGWGYGSFEASYIHFVAERFAAGLTSLPSIPTTFHPHNEFLLWGVEGGIVPLIGLGLAFWSVWSVVLKFELGHRLAIIGLFLPIALHSQVEFPFYASVMHWVIFILLIYYVDTLGSERISVAIKGGAIFKSVGILAPSVAILFLATTVYSGLLLERFNANRIPMADLSKINNPIVWVDRINFSVYVNVLLRGIIQRNPNDVQEYINWVPTLLAREPRPIFYEYLILAHQALNQNQKVDEIVAEYRYLFPQQGFTIVKVN